jgi:RimJ/RimL family protein N-acetyltransferase
MKHLQTARLMISPCCPADRADFMALERDPEVMRFLNGGYAVDHRQDAVETTFLMPRGTEPYVWTARRRATGSFVGWFCLWSEDGKVAELGYRLSRAEWGQGLASEGGSALVDWGFRSARYEHIVACTMAVNQASRRVLEKIGFRHVRTEQVNWADAIPGGNEGEVHYTLTQTA